MGWNDSKEPVSLGKVHAKHFTDKAVLVEFPDGDEQWVPLSQIHDDSEVYDEAHCDGELVVTQWFAEKEGLG